MTQRGTSTGTKQTRIKLCKHLHNAYLVIDLVGNIYNIRESVGREIEEPVSAKENRSHLQTHDLLLFSSYTARDGELRPISKSH